MTLLTWRCCLTAALFGWAAAPPHSVAQTSETRVLGLQGAPNFRDIGGYETVDGRHVRWRMVFRSDALSSITQADEARIARLHIVSEVDLRTVQERVSGPDRWLRPPNNIYESPKPSLAPLIGPMLASVKDALSARAWLQGFYARMPDQYRTEYARLFQDLALGQEPLLIHCTAGKDRTGVASAILLSALGVPRQAVVADYTLTETLSPPTVGTAAATSSRANGALARLPADARMELSRSEDSFILAALRSIDQEYGSVDGYLRTALGLSDADIAKLKARLID